MIHLTGFCEQQNILFDFCMLGQVGFQAFQTRMLAQFFGDIRDEHTSCHEIHDGIRDAGEGLHIRGQLVGKCVIAS